MAPVGQPRWLHLTKAERAADGRMVGGWVLVGTVSGRARPLCVQPLPHSPPHWPRTVTRVCFGSPLSLDLGTHDQVLTKHPEGLISP